MSLFFMLHFSPVTSSIPSLKSLSNNPCEMYPLSANNFPNTLSLSLLNTSGFLSSTLAFVSMKFKSSPLSLHIRWSLKPKYHPIVLLPISAYPLNTLFLFMRLLWQTGTQVLSIKLMPVHLPKQNSWMNSIISTATLDSSSMKRL